MMLKKIGLVVVAAAAGMALFGGMASATSYPSGHNHTGINNAGLEGQAGLVNANNVDALHNVNAVVGLCKNNINVLGIQVPVQDVAKGLNVPILSPGVNGAANNESCAAGAINDGGTHQAN